MRVSIAASTYVESATFPHIVHIFTGEGPTWRKAHAQANALLQLHRKADAVFHAATSSRVSRGVFFGEIKGVRCKTTVRVSKHKE